MCLSTGVRGMRRVGSGKDNQRFLMPVPVKSYKTHTTVHTVSSIYVRTAAALYGAYRTSVQQPASNTMRDTCLRIHDGYHAILWRALVLPAVRTCRVAQRASHCTVRTVQQCSNQQATECISPCPRARRVSSCFVLLMY